MAGFKGKPDKVPVTPRPSSSLLILSPLTSGKSACGYDYRLVMVRRNDRSSFKNATVFPGGNLDTSDHNGDAKVSLAAFKRCAIRETFEETGILISQPRVAFSPGDRAKWRARVHESGTAFSSLLDAYHTTINHDELVRYANWITPLPLARRYDTNFFLTVVDAAETLPARHDKTETLQLNHYTPQEAIELHKRGEIVLFLPQLYMLHDLSAFHSYRDIMTTMQKRPIHVTMPQLVPKLGCVLLPEDKDRGGGADTLHRIDVEFEDGDLKPSHVVRRNLTGFHDISFTRTTHQGGKL